MACNPVRPSGRLKRADFAAKPSGPDGIRVVPEAFAFLKLIRRRIRLAAAALGCAQAGRRVEIHVKENDFRAAIFHPFRDVQPDGTEPFPLPDWLDAGDEPSPREKGLAADACAAMLLGTAEKPGELVAMLRAHERLIARDDEIARVIDRRMSPIFGLPPVPWAWKADPLAIAFAEFADVRPLDLCSMPGILAEVRHGRGETFEKTGYPSLAKALSRICDFELLPKIDFPEGPILAYEQTDDGPVVVLRGIWPQTLIVQFAGKRLKELIEIPHITDTPLGERRIVCVDDHEDATFATLEAVPALPIEPAPEGADTSWLDDLWAPPPAHIHETRRAA